MAGDDALEIELVPIRGRTVSLADPGRVHWGVVWSHTDPDSILWTLCSTLERRYPLYGRRIHRRFEVECKHCLRVAEKLGAGDSPPVE